MGLIFRVSILVLMDAALRHVAEGADIDYCISFNPCFDGCRPATYHLIHLPHLHQSFNPCFDGCRPATIYTMYFTFPLL